MIELLVTSYLSCNIHFVTVVVGMASGCSGYSKPCEILREGPVQVVNGKHVSVYTHFIAHSAIKCAVDTSSEWVFVILCYDSTEPQEEVFEGCVWE